MQTTYDASFLISMLTVHVVSYSFVFSSRILYQASHLNKTKIATQACY
jgi:hypothetical protein